MTGKELLEKIHEIKPTTARNMMGCSENWYNFYFAVSQTFTEAEILGMSETEIANLEKLANNIQEGLY